MIAKTNFLKKVLLLILALPFIVTGTNPIINIPDPNLKAVLLSNPGINTNGDAEIDSSEAANFVGVINVQNQNITDMTGIEAFINIYELDCSYNQITTLDISALSNLGELKCYLNDLGSLDISQNENLTRLNCRSNHIASLNLQNNPLLTSIDCGFNNISALEVFSPVTDLSFENNNTTFLSIADPSALQNINASNNNLGTLDLQNSPNLNLLFASNSSLSSLLFSPACTPQTIEVNNNPLPVLDVNLSNIQFLNVSNTLVLSLNFPASFCPIQQLDCSNTLIDSLNLFFYHNLTDVNCSNSPISWLTLDNSSVGLVANLNALNTPNLNCIQVDNLINANNSNYSIDPDDYFSLNCGCNSPITDAQITGPGLVCFPDVTEFTASATNATDASFYTWTGPNGFAASGFSTGSIQDPGTYTCSILNSEGCSGVVSADLTLSFPPSNPVISGTASFCEGDSTVFTASVDEGLGLEAFVWSGPGGLSVTDYSTGFIQTPGLYTCIITNAGGCTASVSETITILPTPTNATITGVNSICTPNFAEFTASADNTTDPANFLWTTPFGNIFNGFSTGNTQENGTFTCTITLPSGCSATVSRDLTAGTTPSNLSLSGALVVCNGTTDLSITGDGLDASTLANWTGPNGFSSSGLSSGPITESGLYSCTVSNAPNCSATIIDSVAIVPLPTNLSVTGDLANCYGSGTNLSVSASNVFSDTYYEWSGPNNPFPVPGSETGLVFEPGNYSFIITNGSSLSLNGCNSTISVTYSAPVQPTNLFVIGESVICTGGTTTFMAVGDDTDANTTYSWTGPGGFSANTASTGTISTPGIYECVIANGPGCSASISTTLFVGTFPGNPAITGPNTVCVGSSTTFVASATNTNGSTQYLWIYENAAGDPADTISFQPSSGSITLPGSYTCIITNSGTCSVSIIKNLENTQPPTNEQIVSDLGEFICDNQLIYLSASAVIDANAPFLTYSWTGPGGYLGNESFIDSVNVSGTYYCTIASAPNCEVTASKNIQVYPTPTNCFLSGQTTICDSQVTNLIANSSNTEADTPGITTGYEWIGPGLPSSGGGSSFISPDLSEPGVYDCIISNNFPELSCYVMVSATILVDPLPQPTITASTSTSICQGTEVVFTLSDLDGLTPLSSVEWKVNGILAATGATYTTDTLNDNDFVYCSFEANACGTTSTITTNELMFNVQAPVSPSVIISSDLGTSVCQGTILTFSSTSVDGGASPTYEWFLNGNSVGSGETDSGGSFANGDEITCNLTSSIGCSGSSPVTSNTLTLDIIPAASSSVSFTASPNSGSDPWTFCGGAEVTFSATPVNGGTSPQFQWLVNGVAQPSSAGTFVTSALSNNDEIECVLTSSNACVNESSYTQTIQVTNSVTPVVQISASPGTTICAGTVVTFSASPQDPGASSVSYIWSLNGSAIASGNTYTNSTLANNDIVSCEMSATYTCQSSPTATSSVTITQNVCLPTGTISSTTCGSVSVSLTGTVSANYVAGATKYEFEFYDEFGSDLLATVLSSGRTISVSSISPSLSWNTWYQVRVRLYSGVFPGSYGPLCSFKTIADPTLVPLPTTQLSAGSCGGTFTNIGIIYADAVTGATKYEFEISLAGSIVTTKLQTGRALNIASIFPPATWGNTYQVRVRCYFGTDVSDFGTSCNITFIPDPSVVGVPATQLIANNCGRLNFLLASATISAVNVTYATRYEFEFSQAGTVIATKMSSNRFCKLSTVVPALISGEQYVVRVRAYQGTVPGNYGQPCLIGTVLGSRFENPESEEQISETSDVAMLNYMPNPFNESIKINISNAENFAFDVRIFNLEGKLMESTSGIRGTIEMGQTLSQGLYILEVVSSDGWVKRERIIKAN